MIANISHIYFGRARTVLSTEKGNGGLRIFPAKEPLSLRKILKDLSEYVKNWIREGQEKKEPEEGEDRNIASASLVWVFELRHTKRWATNQVIWDWVQIR